MEKFFTSALENESGQQQQSQCSTHSGSIRPFFCSQQQQASRSSSSISQAYLKTTPRPSSAALQPPPGASIVDSLSAPSQQLPRMVVPAALLAVLLLLHQPQAVFSACQSAAAPAEHDDGVSSARAGRQLAAIGGRGFGGGFGRPRVSSRPATTAYRPAAGPPPIFSRPTTPPGRTFGSTPLAGGFSAYGRPGFRSSPFILPLALGGGLLAAGAVSNLNRNPNAYCNGQSVQCYKAACEDALRNRCPEALAAATAAAGNSSSGLLVLSPCPDARFSECYQTPTFNDTDAASFECFGVRRPRYGREDLAGVCHAPGASNSAGSALLSKVGRGQSLVWCGEKAAAAAACLHVVWQEGGGSGSSSRTPHAPAIKQGVDLFPCPLYTASCRCCWW